MRILGIDASSKKIAWSIINEGVLESYGEIFLSEVGGNHRLAATRRKLEDGLHIFGKIDYIAFEKAVRVRSAATVIVLAEMFGVVKSVLMDLGAPMVEMEPLVWQSAIGNPNITGVKKREWLAAHPQFKTKSQIQRGIREYRKQLTLDYVEKVTGVKMSNDDLGDATAIGLVGYQKMKELYG